MGHDICRHIPREEPVEPVVKPPTGEPFDLPFVFVLSKNYLDSWFRDVGQRKGKG
jgi:hypothetical protein